SDAYAGRFAQHAAAGWVGKARARNPILRDGRDFILLDLLSYAFFQRAVIGGVLIGIMAPLVGMFIVLRRLSMIGDTLSHVTIAGVALGLLINVYPLGLGLVVALLAAYVIETLRRRYQGYAEWSIAIILSGGVALASILFSLGKGLSSINTYLFGNILALNETDLWVVFGVTIVVVGAVAVFMKELFLISLDEDAASVSGLPMTLFNMLVTVLTALVVSV